MTWLMKETPFGVVSVFELTFGRGRISIGPDEINIEKAW